MGNISESRDSAVRILAWWRVVCGPPSTDGMFADMAVMVQKISALTLRVTNMRTSVRFYRDVLGMELSYGGEDAYFSSLAAKDAEYPILNLDRALR